MSLGRENPREAAIAHVENWVPRRSGRSSATLLRMNDAAAHIEERFLDRISRARLTVDPGALPCVPALRAKAKARDTPLPSCVRAGGMTNGLHADRLGAGGGLFGDAQDDFSSRVVA